MTKEDVIRKAIEKKITWTQAATVCRVKARHMRRLRKRYELFQIEGCGTGRRGTRKTGSTERGDLGSGGACIVLVDDEGIEEVVSWVEAKPPRFVHGR